jgi:hypothetical protein
MKFEQARAAGRSRPRSRTYRALAILFVTAWPTNARVPAEVWKESLALYAETRERATPALPKAGGRSSEKLLARPWVSQAEPSGLRGTRGFPLDPALGAQPGGVFVWASGATVWRPEGAGYSILHGTGVAASAARTLEHRQLPLRTSLVKAQNVPIAIVAFDFEVAIV